MAKRLTVDHISKSYGEKTLFEDARLTIEDGDRIGLIGINGIGKSTLLKIIAGIETTDSGEVYASIGYRIAFLPQQPCIDEEATVMDQIFKGDSPLIKLQREYERVQGELMENPLDEAAQTALFLTQQQMDAENAWDAHTQVKAMLMRLGVTDLTEKMKHLSGGERKRVAMASCIATDPDLLILDEPTNHLDHDMIEWLEQYLSRYRGSLLFVTHDRYFLDRVTTRIIELDGGKLFFYDGNYSSFLKGRALREEMALAGEEKRQNLYRRELAWIRQGARARTTKQKARIQRFEALKNAEGVAAKEQINISLSSNRLGKKVLELTDISKAFDDKVILDNFSYIIGPNSRIGIVGPNGSGKSTLLNILAGMTVPDSGVIDLGITVKLAYYTQEIENMDLSMRLINYIKEVAEVVYTKDGKAISASMMLERFLFPTYMHGLPLAKLSGGERRRLYLLKLLMGEPNLLLLDEPTNDLDTQTLTILEDYLETFPGVVVAVSHDRYFLDKVVDELIMLEGGGKITTALGAYTDFLANLKASNAKTVAKTKNPKIIERPKQKNRKLSYHEKREWEGIEDEIAELEVALGTVMADLAQAGSDYVRAQELLQLQEELEAKLDAKMDRWTQLAELIESFEE